MKLFEYEFPKNEEPKDDTPDHANDNPDPHATDNPDPQANEISEADAILQCPGTQILGSQNDTLIEVESSQTQNGIRLF